MIIKSCGLFFYTLADVSFLYGNHICRVINTYNSCLFCITLDSDYHIKMRHLPTYQKINRKLISYQFFLHQCIMVGVMHYKMFLDFYHFGEILDHFRGGNLLFLTTVFVYFQYNFHEIIGEPPGAHSADCVWVNAYKCFNCSANCCYLFLT